MMDKQLVAGALFFSSLQAFGTDFSDADAKFAQRDVNLQSTLDARAAYRSLLETASKDADKLRAAEGYLRTYMFEGTHYHSLDDAAGREARKAVFSSCWSEAAETISPVALGFETPVYYYFRSACLAYDAQVSDLEGQLALVPKLLDAVQKGLQTEGGTSYEAGGIYRVAAAVKYNPAAQEIPGGLFNPQEALVLINQAIAAPPYAEGSISGQLYCENFSHKVRNLLVLGQPAEALTLATQSLSDFEQHLATGAIPEYVRAETMDCLSLLTQLKGSLETSTP
ncbi:MAG TPA: hypothetical protein VE954_07645 [Oligoflexus sp.]|uniref:hypothetical protein n=1 Tax=Oligoflexus sp. TaxID=1971216 RepID=UPI002D3504DA|nr:hypothetical protein [Oligoflexus sp.]HYX32973.1 hypothetical protein [Oligoflexus sp.]